jgi:hypothetical protein
MTIATSRPSVVRHEPIGAGFPAASLPWLLLVSMQMRPPQVMRLILPPSLVRSAMPASRSAISDRSAAIMVGADRE